MAKEFRYRFIVSGYGAFPVDMLRYDSCWPEHEIDSGSLMGSFFPRGRQHRAIHIMGLRKPTEARWESFGWTVDPESHQKITLV